MKCYVIKQPHHVNQLGSSRWYLANLQMYTSNDTMEKDLNMCARYDQKKLPNLMNYTCQILTMV